MNENKNIKCIGCCTYTTSSIKSLVGHKRRCKSWKELAKSWVDKNPIHEMYVIEKKSVLDIVESLGLPKEANAVISRYLKENNWRRTVKECAEQTNLLQKRKDTNNQMYGHHHNFCKNHPSRIKWENELFLTEGIINVFQRKEVKEKSVKTFLEKYDVANAALLPRKGRENFSNIHKFVYALLCYYLDNEVFLEKRLAYESTYFSYDLLINNTKMLVEVNGDYWHANPQLYKPNDVILYGSTKNKLAKDIWEKDQLKIDHAINLGYNVHVVWEHDLKNNIQECIKTLLNWISHNDEQCKNKIDNKDPTKYEIRFRNKRQPQLFCK